MTHHTAGPWKSGETSKGGFGVWATSQMYNVLDHTAPGIDAEANARLIAAAPEMLEALKISTTALEVVVSNDSKNIAAKCCIKRNKEAIAKAEGLEVKA